MDLKVQKIKKNYNAPLPYETLNIATHRIPSRLTNIDMNHHHNSPKQQQLTSANSAKQSILNPFNDPPSDCTESDVRWVWRQALEEKRGHIKNKLFYSHYVGTKKSRQYVSSNPHLSKSNLLYDGNHHLKHLVKIGCPKHDLAPILSEIGYNVNECVCTHKSHLCTRVATMQQQQQQHSYFMGSVSMKDVGLIFKRNAFSTLPLKIEYAVSSNPCIKPIFSTEIYIKRIANTNFSKAFRPGSYGNLQSLKKGSWKEGKIFYAFEGDELKLNINDNLWICFDLKSSASDSNNEQNTIDGWKSIVGGVGLWCPPDSDSIASVLVLRKSINFPLECLQNSTIKIYSKMQHPNGATLYIGNKAFRLHNNQKLQMQRGMVQQQQQQQQQQIQSQICRRRPNVVPNLMQMRQNYENLLQSFNHLRSENMRLMNENNSLQQEKSSLASHICQLEQHVVTQNQQIERLNNDISVVCNDGCYVTAMATQAHAQQIESVSSSGACSQCSSASCITPYY